VLDRCAGNQCDVIQRIDEQASIDELVWKKLVLRVGEYCLQLDGSGIGINLVVDARQRTGGQTSLLFPVVSFYGQLLARFYVLQNFWKIVFGYRENNRDRLQLGNDHQPVRVGSMHHIPDIDQAQSDASADRRGDAAITELQLGIIDLSLIGFHYAFVLTH